MKVNKFEEKIETAAQKAMKASVHVKNDIKDGLHKAKDKMSNMKNKIEKETADRISKGYKTFEDTPSL